MAKPTKKNESKRTEWVNVCDGVSIRLSKGDFFSIAWYGAVIHGCAVRNGRNGYFISYPSFKGSDGNYIKRAYIYAPAGSEDAKTLELVVARVLEERESENA